MHHERELFNTISHLIASLLAFLGIAVLLSLVSSKNMQAILAIGIYGVTTIALYVVSTIYHGCRGKNKKILQRLDHILIYLKIAGNYTPFAILALRSFGGNIVLSIMWVLAIIGIIQEIIIGQKTRRLSMAIYVVMSASVAIVLKELAHILPLTGFLLIIGTFLFYAIGLYFYINDERIKHGHGIWHLFVVGGSTCQYLCLLIYII